MADYRKLTDKKTYGMIEDGVLTELWVYEKKVYKSVFKSEALINWFYDPVLGLESTKEEFEAIDLQWQHQNNLPAPSGAWIDITTETQFIKS